MRASKAYFHWEMQQLLTDMAYVDLGLVPPSHYPRNSQGSLDSCLSQLDPADARKAKRKFRKLLRKSQNASTERASYEKRQSRVKWYIIERYVNLTPIDNDE